MASRKGRPRFSQMTRYMLDDSIMQASEAYTGKDFSKVVNAMVRSIESQIAEKIKVDIANINGVLKASFIAPTLKKDAIIKAMEATRGALPKALNSYVDAMGNPLTYGISATDLESVYMRKIIKGKKAQTKLESNVAQMQGDVKYTDEKEVAYVRLLKDPATASESTDRYLKEKASKGVGVLNREEQRTRDKQRQAEEDKKRKEDEKAQKEAEKERQKAESASRRLLLGRIALLVGILKGIHDVAKRILTTTMRFAVAERTRQTLEHDLNMERGQYLKNQYVAQSMGLDKDAINSAIASVQGKFGNITELDEKSIEKLALVMGEDVKELIASGMGGENPQALTEKIINAFYQKIMRGESSVGEKVGQASARRELVSYLQKIDPQLSKMLSAMLELNSSGALAGKITEWSDVVNALTPKERFGVDETDLNAVSAFAQQLNIAKASLKSFSDALKAWSVKHFGGLVDTVNDWTSGMSKADVARKILSDAQTREGRKGQLRTRISENRAFMESELRSLGIDTSDWTDEDFINASLYISEGVGLKKGKAKGAKDALSAYRLSVATGGDTTLLNSAVSLYATSSMLKELEKEKKGYKELTYGEEQLNLNVKDVAKRAEDSLYGEFFLNSPSRTKKASTPVWKTVRPEVKPIIERALGLYLQAMGTNAKVFPFTYGKGKPYSSKEEVLEAFNAGTLDEKTKENLLLAFWNLGRDEIIPGYRDFTSFMGLAYEERNKSNPVSNALFQQEMAKANVSSWVAGEAKRLRDEGNKVYSYTVTPYYNEKTGTSSLVVTINGKDLMGEDKTLFRGSLDMGASWTSKQISEMHGVEVDLSNTSK